MLREKIKTEELAAQFRIDSRIAQIEAFGNGHINDTFRIGSADAGASDYLLQRDIRKYYIDNITIEMPNDFLKRWLLATNEKLTQEEIDKEYAAFAEEMKWDLIRNKIAKDHEVKVESQEIREAAIASIEAQFGQPGILAQFGEQGESIIRNFLEKNYMQVFNQTQSQKVLDFIKEKITLERKKVSLDEFKELIGSPERKN